MFPLEEADTTHVFHIAEAQAWQAALGQAFYVPRAFDEEGFIHFSYARQVRATAQRYYSERDDLLLLQCVAAGLAPDLKDENLLGGTALFPHLYAPLAHRAINALARIHWTSSSTFELREL